MFAVCLACTCSTWRASTSGSSSTNAAQSAESTSKPNTVPPSSRVPGRARSRRQTVLPVLVLQLTWVEHPITIYWPIFWLNKEKFLICKKRRNQIKKCPNRKWTISFIKGQTNPECQFEAFCPKELLTIQLCLSRTLESTRRTFLWWLVSKFDFISSSYLKKAHDSFLTFGG